MAYNQTGEQFVVSRPRIDAIASIAFFTIAACSLSGSSHASSGTSCYFPNSDASSFDDHKKRECLYVGAGLNYTLLDPDARSAGSSVTDDNDNGWSISLGWRFLPKWFTEFSYSDQGNATVTSGSSQARIDYTTRSLMVGYDALDINEHLHLYVKAGLSNIDGSVNGSANIDTDDNQLQFSAGSGLEYRWNNAWFARLNVDLFSQDVQQLGLSINRYLGSSSTRHRPKREVRVTDIEDTVSIPSTGYSLSNNKSSSDKQSRKNIDSLPIRKTEPIQSIQLVERTAPIVEQVPNRTANRNLARQSPSQDCGKLTGVLNELRFENNSSYIKSASKSQLSQYAKILKRYPNTVIKVSAHTDSVGDSNYNQWLSERRAHSVTKFLTQNGVSSQQLEAEGIGEKNPIASNDTEDGRKANRRVEFSILKSDSCLQ